MGITVTRATGADLVGVLAFEAAAFPSWLRWFSAADEDVLLARDSARNIAGTLIFSDERRGKHERTSVAR
jgi:hypothetical protein